MTTDETDPSTGIRRSPTGRVPQWVLDEEAARLGARAGGHGSPRRVPDRSAHRARAKRHRVIRVLPMICSILAVTLIVGYYAFPGLPNQVTTAIAGEQFTAPGTGVVLPDGRVVASYPPRGVEAQQEPLGQPAPVALSSGSYFFIDGDTKEHFVAYDPCRPIHYVTRPDNAPPGGQRLIAEAVAAASKASGLVFIDDGGTSEALGKDRSSYQPDRYGKRWVPVLIVWETVAEQPKFATSAVPGAKNVAGLGGSQPIVGDTGSKVFVTGTVQLNAPLLRAALAGPGGAGTARAVIQHELGHVLGLGHVSDPTQLMYETAQPGVTTFMAGDLTGLAKLGEGKCFPNH